MARATQDQVRAIIDFDPTIEDLSPFIDAASELVTELCAPTANGYTEDRLTMIETWLAAHFLAIRDPRYASESIGAASVTLQQQTGLNLALTPYGQQAQLLDTKGGLSWIDKHISQGKRATVKFLWLGKDRQEWYRFPWRYLSLP